VWERRLSTFPTSTKPYTLMRVNEVLRVIGTIPLTPTHPHGGLKDEKLYLRERARGMVLREYCAVPLGERGVEDDHIDRGGEEACFLPSHKRRVLPASISRISEIILPSP
jgi:hypothetical protein